MYLLIKIIDRREYIKLMHSRAGVIFTKSVLTGINVISAKKT
jgi:hypothetical protein